MIFTWGQFWGDWPWLSRSNLTWKSQHFSRIWNFFKLCGGPSDQGICLSVCTFIRRTCIFNLSWNFKICWGQVYQLQLPSLLYEWNMVDINVVFSLFLFSDHGFKLCQANGLAKCQNFWRSIQANKSNLHESCSNVCRRTSEHEKGYCGILPPPSWD